MKKIFFIIILIIPFIFNGCLLFHTVEYEVMPMEKGGGKATVTIEDIRSDALNEKELDEDKKNLFKFMYKSDEFVQQMKDEGKTITNRILSVKNDKLIGKIDFHFDDIEIVEGIIYEKPFYYLTLAQGDSIISTNGEIIYGDDYKRIMWDNSIKILKFKMFSDSFEGQKLINMAEYFDDK